VDTLAGRPYWQLHFTEDGRLEDAAQADALVREVAREGVADLVVISHGWNSGPKSAERMYAELLPLVVEQMGQVPGLGSCGLVGLHWPSIWWPETPATDPGPGRGGDAQSTSDVAVAVAEASGTRLAETLREGFQDDGRRAAVERLGRLVDEGEEAAAQGTEPYETQRARLAEFSRLLSELLPAEAIGEEDSGELSFLDRDDPQAFVELARAFGNVPTAGAAQGAGDVFRTVWKGAKDGLRVFSYYTMKARAGTIGQRGLGPVLARLRLTPATAPVRAHLVGHSFGGRLVAFSVSGIPSPDASPVTSLVLVQAAFSHFAFATAKDNPFGKEGVLRPYVDRVKGPLVATWSEHDWAVGRWYPKASALARQDNQANPAVSRWGGLGADGFQAVHPLSPVDLLEPGEEYDFAPANFYTVDASEVIADWRQSAFSGAHSDIRRPAVAWLIAAAARAGAQAASR
jgi:hypothetical protein